MQYKRHQQLEEIRHEITELNAYIAQLTHERDRMQEEVRDPIAGLLQDVEDVQEVQGVQGGKSIKKHTTSKHTSKKLKPTSKPKRPQSAQLMKKKSSLKISH